MHACSTAAAAAPETRHAPRACTAQVKAYAIIAVAFIVSVCVRWKTLFVEWWLLRQQRRLKDSLAAPGSSSTGSSKALGTTEDMERLLVPLDA